MDSLDARLNPRGLLWAFLILSGTVVVLFWMMLSPESLQKAFQPLAEWMHRTQDTPEWQKRQRVVEMAEAIKLASNDIQQCPVTMPGQQLNPKKRD